MATNPTMALFKNLIDLGTVFSEIKALKSLSCLISSLTPVPVYKQRESILKT